MKKKDLYFHKDTITKLLYIYNSVFHYDLNKFSTFLDTEFDEYLLGGRVRNCIKLDSTDFDRLTVSMTHCKERYDSLYK